MKKRLVTLDQLEALVTIPTDSPVNAWEVFRALGMPRSSIPSFVRRGWLKKVAPSLYIRTTPPDWTPETGMEEVRRTWRQRQTQPRPRRNGYSHPDFNPALQFRPRHLQRNP